MSNAPDAPTEAEMKLLVRIDYSTTDQEAVVHIRAHVAAEVAKATAELLKDKERLDWMERYLSDSAKNISGPYPNSPGWEFGYNGGMAYVIDGGGDTLRDAIDAARAQQKDT